MKHNVWFCGHHNQHQNQAFYLGCVGGEVVCSGGGCDEVSVHIIAPPMGLK